jgi:hypothetical protein
MTKSQIIFVTIVVIIFIISLIEVYKIFILKKKDSRILQGILVLIIIVFSLYNSWNAEYFSHSAESKRIEYDIPPIEQGMYLFNRTKFKEEWLNNDSAKIQHSYKVISLGFSIERETDYFTNEIENKTLIIETTYPFFENYPNKDFRLINGILKGEDLFSPTYIEKEIDFLEKDSILIKWGLKE